MNHVDTKYLNLIFKKLSGQITPEELQDLEQWLEQSPDHQRVYREQEQIFLMTAQVDKGVFSVDVDKEWQRFQNRISGGHVVDFTHFLRPAMAVAAVLVLFFALWFLLTPQKTYMARGGTKEIVLPDHSVVKLHQGSRLIVLRGFNKNTRTVKLKGDAYFIVTHNVKKSFRVKADGFVVQVMGTEFMVSQPRKKVMVNKGTVKVGTVSAQQILHAGEQAQVRDHQIIKSQVKDKNIIAWATGVFCFEDEPLHSVFETLEENYGVKIIIRSPGAKNMKLTATFKDKDLDFILNVIANTEGIHIYKTAPKVYVVK